jgi:endo-1,4-beta-xylanase
MKVRGHTFVWHQMVPRWLSGSSASPGEVAAILRDHIRAEMEHFKGRVLAWDVINEATASDPPSGPRRTFWLEKIGSGYIDKAFSWAPKPIPLPSRFTTTTVPTA